MTTKKKFKFTLIVWNDRRLIVRQVSVAPNTIGDWCQMVRMRRILRHEDGDPRWQVICGHLKVDASLAKGAK